VVAGVAFYNLQAGPLESIQMRGNLIYLNLLLLLLAPYVGISLFTNDKRVYLADVSGHLYRPSCFYLAKVCTCCRSF
jgi:hypothetical protein